MRRYFYICFFAVVSLVSANPKNVGDKQLEIKLKSDDVAVRLESVKSLVSKMPDKDKDIKEILIAHYKSLPKERSTGAVKAEMEREMIVEAVAKDKSPESEKFLVDVLNEEYGNVLREQEEGCIFNLPCAVRDTATGLVATYYNDSEILKEIVAKWLASNLEFTFKQNLTATKIAFDMHSESIADIPEQVKYIAGRIKPGPITPIPEDIYVDREKRIAYGKTAKCKKEDELVGKYFRSQEGILEAGLELALEHLGRKAVEYIVDYVKNNKMEREKSDLLISIASQIMGDYVNVTRKLSAEDKKVLDEIQKYSEGMENQGVFDREDEVKGNLKRIEELLK